MYNNYFSNKIILITGGGSGMGRGLCQKLAECGAIVICTDINQANVEETGAQITDPGRTAVARKLDVTQLQDFEDVLADIVNEHGRIDMVFNNAGIGITGEIRDLTIEHWKKVIDINFYGVLHGSTVAYRYMIKQGSGQIVNTASLAGLISYIPLIAPYSVSKHAIVNFSRCLRQEAKLFNIKVNIVCPGLIDTPIISGLPAINSKPGWNEHAIKAIAPGASVAVAVDHILKGVAKNKQVILFPFIARALFLFARYLKGGYLKIVNKQMMEFRDDFRINDGN
jgi:NAD(P)-dependent dehydrogenase (short-subunit alcohol dehydrogenase family)